VDEPADIEPPPWVHRVNRKIAFQVNSVRSTRAMLKLEPKIEGGRGAALDETVLMDD
jgi:hypothetical protein